MDKPRVRIFGPFLFVTEPCTPDCCNRMYRHLSLALGPLEVAVVWHRRLKKGR